MGQSLSIKQVKDRTGMSDHTLRYYEKIGLLNSVGRLDNGRRIYTEFDVERIKTLQLLRSTGMTIRDMLYLAQLIDEGDASIEQRIAYFKTYQAELRKQIAAREDAIKIMDKKIKRHQMLLHARDKR